MSPNWHAIFLNPRPSHEDHNKIYFTIFGSTQLHLSFFKVAHKTGHKWTILQHNNQWQLGPAVSWPHRLVKQKQGSSAKSTRVGHSSSPASPPAKASAPTWSTEQTASGELGGGGAGVAERARRRPWRHGGAALWCAGHHWPQWSQPRSAWDPWRPSDAISTS